jgi:hypothetical protein
MKKQVERVLCLSAIKWLVVVSCLSSGVALGKSAEEADSEEADSEEADSEETRYEPSSAMLEFIAMFDEQASTSSEEWIDPLVISDALDASDAALVEFEKGELINQDR